MTPTEAAQLLWTEPPEDGSVIRLNHPALRLRDPRALLSLNEQQIWVNLTGEARRTAFIAGRAAAKHRISICLKLGDHFNFQDIDIGRAAGGAPALCIRGESVEDVSVSISHGGEFAYSGAVRNARLGLDVEPISSKCASLKESFATQDELEVLLGRTAEKDEAEALTRLFSAKEAAAKCLGTHMYFAFHHYQLTAVSQAGLGFKDTSALDRQFVVDTTVKDRHVFSKILISEII